MDTNPHRLKNNPYVFSFLCAQNQESDIFTSRVHSTTSEKEFKGSEQLRGPVIEYEA